MVNEEMLRTAKEIISMGLIERDGLNAWKVDEQVVLNKVFPGRSYLSCSCLNQTINCNETGLDCQHKCAVIIFEATFPYQHKINKLIREYDGYKKIKMAPNIDAFIEDLKSIRGFL